MTACSNAGASRSTDPADHQRHGPTGRRLLVCHAPDYGKSVRWVRLLADPLGHAEPGLWPPLQHEQQAFCDRLNEITAAGGQLRRVQIYTVARRPAESFVAALSDAEVDSIGALVRDQTTLPVDTYYGQSN